MQRYLLSFIAHVHNFITQKLLLRKSEESFDTGIIMNKNVSILEYEKISELLEFFRLSVVNVYL